MLEEVLDYTYELKNHKTTPRNSMGDMNKLEPNALVFCRTFPLA